MATSQKLTEHFLTCPVCLEVFTKPCTLTCQHSFCVKCVISYTKTQPKAVKAKSVPCPFCDRLTKVPDPDRPVEDWAEQLKPGILLVGLLDSFGPQSKDTTNCNLCHDEGEITPAVSWCSVCDVALCSSCLKAHRRIPSTRHHDVTDLSGEVKVTQKRKATCHKHKDEYIKFYCKDCDKTLCQSCCIIYHRKCDSVVSLESMVPEIRTKLQTKKEHLKKTLDNEVEQLEGKKSQFTSIQQEKSSIQSQIRSTAQKAMDAIKKKEKQLMDELDEITDKQMGQLKADIKSGDMAIQIYKQQSEMIDQALNSASEVDMYDLYKSSEYGVVGTLRDRDVKGRGGRIEFLQDMEKIKIMLDELPLGEIKVVTESVFDRKSTPVHTDTINCRTTDDEDQSPILFDVLCVDVNGTHTLIVTDYSNTCVKSFYNRNKQPKQSRVVLKSNPFCLVKLEENRLAVTLPDSSQIATLTVTPDLSLLSYITTSKHYYGLTVLTPTTLAAGSYSPPCVDILDRSGNVLQSISPLHNIQKIIHNPNFLCTTKKGNILVSDCGTESVLCLTPQGDVVFNYSPTGDREQASPAGITVTDTGGILVVDFYLDKVIQLSESGQFVRDILTQSDGLYSPRGLHCDESGSIYVTHEDEDGEENVQVFTFKK